MLSVVCAGLTTLVKVNYNLSDYLPDDSETKVAMEVLYDEFGDNGTLTVMASDLSLKESLEFKNQIAGVENVESVLWLDTALGEYLTQYKTIIGIMWPQTKDMDEEQMLDFMLGLLDSDSESAEDGEPKYSRRHSSDDGADGRTLLQGRQGALSGHLYGHRL